MTKQGSFKRLVRRRAEETGQRYTEALADLDGTGLNERTSHAESADRVASHLAKQYGIDVVGVVKAGVHSELVFRVDCRDGRAWIARVFPPARTIARVQGDVAVLHLLRRHGFPAERIAADDPVSMLDRQCVMVTEALHGQTANASLSEEADLLGRLHSLPLDATVSREGGAFGHDVAHEGSPGQDLFAAMSFLQSVEDRVAGAHRPRFEQLCEQIASAEVDRELPQALLHGDLVSGNHVVVTESGPVSIHWQASGRGPRLAELAFLLWTSGGEPDRVETVLGAYGRHVRLTDHELDRVEGLVLLKPLYLAAWYYWRSVETGYQPTGAEGWWSFTDAAAATRIAETTREIWCRIR